MSENPRKIALFLPLPHGLTHHGDGDLLVHQHHRHLLALLLILFLLPPPLKPLHGDELIFSSVHVQLQLRHHVTGKERESSTEILMEAKEWFNCTCSHKGFKESESKRKDHLHSSSYWFRSSSSKPMFPPSLPSSI